MKTTTVYSLSVGDTILDRDGFEMRVTGLVRGKRTSEVTVEYTEASMMASRPQPTTRRVSNNSMVEVA